MKSKKCETGIKKMKLNSYQGGSKKVKVVPTVELVTDPKTKQKAQILQNKVDFNRQGKETRAGIGRVNYYNNDVDPVQELQRRVTKDSTELANMGIPVKSTKIVKKKYQDGGKVVVKKTTKPETMESALLKQNVDLNRAVKNNKNTPDGRPMYQDAVRKEAQRRITNDSTTLAKKGYPKYEEGTKKMIIEGSRKEKKLSPVMDRIDDNRASINNLKSNKGSADKIKELQSNVTSDSTYLANKGVVGYQHRSNHIEARDSFSKPVKVEKTITRENTTPVLTAPTKKSSLELSKPSYSQKKVTTIAVPKIENRREPEEDMELASTKASSLSTNSSKSNIPSKVDKVATPKKMNLFGRLKRNQEEGNAYAASIDAEDEVARTTSSIEPMKPKESKINVSSSYASKSGDDNFVGPTRKDDLTYKAEPSLDEVSKDKAVVKTNVSKGADAKLAQWQQKHGLKADGIWGEKSKAKYAELQKAKAPKKMTLSKTTTPSSTKISATTLGGASRSVSSVASDRKDKETNNPSDSARIADYMYPDPELHGSRVNSRETAKKLVDIDKKGEEASFSTAAKIGVPVAVAGALAYGAYKNKGKMKGASKVSNAIREGVEELGSKAKNMIKSSKEPIRYKTPNYTSPVGRATVKESEEVLSKIKSKAQDRQKTQQYNVEINRMNKEAESKKVLNSVKESAKAKLESNKNAAKAYSESMNNKAAQHKQASRNKTHIIAQQVRKQNSNKPKSEIVEPRKMVFEKTVVKGSDKPIGLLPPAKKDVVASQNKMNLAKANEAKNTKRAEAIQAKGATVKEQKGLDNEFVFDVVGKKARQKIADKKPKYVFDSEGKYLGKNKKK